MKRPSLSDTLRFAAVIALALVSYPLIAVKNCISDYVSPEVNLCELAVIVLLAAAGYFIGAATDKFQVEHPFLHLMMSVLIFTAVTALTGFIVFASGYANGATLYLDSIAAGGVIVAALYLYYADYSSIFSFSKISIISVIFVISCLVVYLSQRPYSISHYAVILLTIYSVFGLITNQKHIDDIMSRRHHSVDSLPKKIRYFNIRLLVFMFAVIVILFLFRKQLAALIKSLFTGIIYLILWIAELIGRLISLLMVTEEPPEELPEMVEELPEIKEQPDMFPLLAAVAIAILIYVIIRRRKKIIRSLRAAWTAVKRFVAKVLNLKFNRKQDKATDGYTDTEEYLGADNHKRRRRRPQNVWRKNYRAYLKMQQDSETYRFGYGLLVSALTRHYPTVTSSMTPIEICSAVSSLPSLSIQLPTEVYNTIRYGEQGYDGSFAELNAALEAVRKFG